MFERGYNIPAIKKDRGKVVEESCCYSQYFNGWTVSCEADNFMIGTDEESRFSVGWPFLSNVYRNRPTSGGCAA